MVLTIPATSMQQRGVYQITATGLTNGGYEIYFDGPYLPFPLSVSGQVTTGQNLILTTTNSPSIVLSGSGISTSGFSITLTGPSGNYAVDTSTDLINWQNIGSVSINYSGESTFTDTNAPGTGSQRFYKAQSQ
jgi:hypothetical protein